MNQYTAFKLTRMMVTNPVIKVQELKPRQVAPKLAQPINHVVICGPSGSGKSTLIRTLIAKYPDQLYHSVSYTTRPAREGELDGIHYRFITEEEFLNLISRKMLVEYSKYSGHWYGTSRDFLQVSLTMDEQGDSVGSSDRGKSSSHVDDPKDKPDEIDAAAVPLDEAEENSWSCKICVLDVNVDGVRQLKRYVRDNPHICPMKFIFLKPPNMNVLKERLDKRGSESDLEIQIRLDKARAELNLAESEQLFDRVIENDNYNKAFSELESLMQEDLFKTKFAPVRRRSR